MNQAEANLENFSTSENESVEVGGGLGWPISGSSSISNHGTSVGQNSFELWSPFQHQQHQTTSESIFHELQSRKVL